MSDEKPWLYRTPLFSSRYGVAKNRDEQWAKRHVWVEVGKMVGLDGEPVAGMTIFAAPIATHPCLCAGIHFDTLEGRQCTLEATQEDMRCDECWQWCRYNTGRLLPDAEPSNVVRVR